VTNSPNSRTYSTSIDQGQLPQFIDLVVSDLAGTYSAVLVYIGDKLGSYKAMKDAGKPITSEELAAMTNTSERNIRE
jgi:hypothetical protein